MKFFKYLIFIFLLISVQVKADWYIEVLGQNYGVFPTTDAACKANRDRISSSFTYQVEGTNCKLFSNGSLFGQYQLIQTASQCSPQSIKSKPITVTGWTNWTLDQTDAYTAKIKGQTACYNGCKYKDPIIAGESDNQFKISFANPVKDSSCPATSDLPDTPYPDNVTPPADGCKSGEAYCDKPPTGCPTGYTSGSFNGKQICVKNNPDPTKPNPNDPNNNPNNSKFDDSKIIAAINASKDAITSSINNAVNSINSSISSINQSITTVANAVNGTTNAVNNNTNAVNAVKSSVDALHNTINTVTAAVNNNTNSVTSAVNSNTSATNAVKASVDALNSTVSAVTTAVDNNTKAVNASGDKVANAVKDNTTATNAVKTAVENLNTSVNAVSDAVKTNGKNTVDAVNANGDKVSNAINANGDKVTEAVNKGVEATKENGKKLDGIKDGVENGNGILKQISKTLSEIKDFITEKPELENGTDPQAPDDQGIFDRKFNTVFSLSKSCPPDIPFNYDTEFLKGNFSISLNWLCLIFTFLAYPLQFLSHCIGLWILYEAAIRKEIKW